MAQKIEQNNLAVVIPKNANHNKLALSYPPHNQHPPPIIKSIMAILNDNHALTAPSLHLHTGSFLETRYWLTGLGLGLTMVLQLQVQAPGKVQIYCLSGMGEESGAVF